MKQAIYSKAYNALLERLNRSNPAIAAGISGGTVAVNPVVYYFRRKLSTSITKYLQDWNQSRTTGITNLVDGKFPYKMTAAFSHIGIAYGYSASDVAASSIKYTNHLYNPTRVAEVVIGSNSYAAESDIVDTDVVNSEITVGLGDITVFNRTPMAQFFKQARYQTDETAKGGIMSIYNAYELYEPVTCTDANEPNVEISWNNGASLTDHAYIEFAFHGVEVAVR